uniref:ATP synthase complex subunit 8 n=1 Tax=Telmatobufo australis TaxID=93483 RepID=A0A0G3F7X5_9NEOB
MPQLNPSPWLMIMVFSWIVLILFILKTANYKDLNDPSLKPLKGLNTPWSWPWP